MIKNEYFNHIDVLRFIAVFSVILFHIDSNLFPRGYLGVDIFFVISGFVITNSLYKEFNLKKKIDILNFYARRLKRIYPALIFVLFLSLITYLIFGILNNADIIFNSSFFSLFGLSNFYFIHIDQDYFLSNDNNFLIHTWSLAIEEQFYFIYPFLYFFIFKYFNKNYVLLFSILTIFFFLIFLSFELTKKNFFLPYIRAWELSIGCLAFLLIKKIKKTKLSILQYPFFFIIILILFTNPLNIGNKTEITITIFCLFIFLILFNEAGNNIIFKNKILNYLGKSSYSIYLWHLPVFYFTSLINLNIVYQLIIILFISSFSYHLIENKFRYSDNFYKYLKVFIKNFILLILIGFIILIIFFENFVNRTNQIVKENKNLFYDINYNSKNKYLRENKSYKDYSFLNNPGNFCLQESEISFYFENCFKNNNSKELFILGGDSTAASLLPLFDKFTSNDYDLLFIGKSGNFVAPEVLSFSDELLSDKNFKSGTSDQAFNEMLFDTANKMLSDYSKIYLFLGSDYFTYITEWNLTDENIKKIPDNKKKQVIAESLGKIQNKLKPSIDLIFLIRPFKTKNSLIDCLINLKTFKDCMNSGIATSIKKFNYFPESLKSSTNKRLNSHIIDFSDIFCLNKKCSNLIDEKKVFIDDKVHFTIDGNIILLKYFEQWFNKTYAK